MDEDLVRGVQVMVAQLAFLSAAIHAAVVARRLPSAIASGTIPRPATVLISLAVLGIVAGVVAFRYELAPRRTVYWFGIVLMLGQVVGWLTYHNLELLGFGHSHGNPLWSVLEHVEADVVEATAKVAELLAAAGLALLLRGDPRARRSTLAPAADEDADAPRT